MTALRKIGIGMFLTAGSFLVSVWIETQIENGGKPSIGWQFIAYIFLTSAEVMVSITALEFAYTQAPKKMKSMIQSVELLSISLGNVIAAVVNDVIKNEDGTSKLPGASYYWFFTIAMLVTAVLFIPVAARYKVKDYIQDEANQESKT
jgi:POT family proton-dependent oligopeptide transporter